MKKKYYFVILFLVLAVFLSGCSGGGITPPITTNQSPTASFTANPTSGVAPLEVSFNASNSSDSDGTIVSYAWDFKDGYTGNGVTVNHTFNSTGSYNVLLTVIDNEGATDSTTKNITITETLSNQSPTASFTANPTSGVAPLEVSFNASNSSDSDGTIVSYAWDFKDGTIGNGKILNHTFSSKGSYNVMLTVIDNEGATDSETKTITVTDYNAEADFDVCENILIAFYAALSNQNFSQALSYCKNGGATYDYVNDLWDIALDWPQFYTTYQIINVYDFFYWGESAISCYYDHSYTIHDIWGGTDDTEYKYGSAMGFDKINGEWKMF